MNFEDQKIKMPFPETDEQVRSYVQRCTEHIITDVPKNARTMHWQRWAAAASIILMIGAGSVYWVHRTAEDVTGIAHENMRLDEFLENLSDEEAQQIICIDCEEFASADETHDEPKHEHTNL